MLVPGWSCLDGGGAPLAFAGRRARHTQSRNDLGSVRKKAFPRGSTYSAVCEHGPWPASWKWTCTRRVTVTPRFRREGGSAPCYRKQLFPR